MKTILIFLLLLVHSAAFAGLTFDISCGNVTKVVIIRTDDQFLDLHTPQGFVYCVVFDLRPDAKDEFRKIVDTSRKLIVHRDAMGGYSREKLTITANGKPLRNDVPKIDGHGGAKVGTFILLKEDAFDTARSVCPTVPIELIIPPKVPSHGQRE